MKTTLALFLLAFTAYAASAQNCVVHNYTSADVDLEIIGIDGSCNGITFNFTSQAGQIEYPSVASGIEYLVGSSVVSNSCQTSAVVKDYSESPCSGSSVVSANFTSNSGCYYAVNTTLKIEIVVAGTDIDIYISEP